MLPGNKLNIRREEDLSWTFSMHQILCVTLFLVFPMTQCTFTGKQKAINDAAQCVLDILPYNMWGSRPLFMDNYLPHIIPQWDPLNPHDYLSWPVYDGPEDWAASCHFSSAMEQCLLPLSRYHLIETNPPVYSILIAAFYYLSLCEHQSTLADPRTNNAQCVHQRMLSDDVLRCQGLVSWQKGNPFLLVNRYEKNLRDFKWIGHAAANMYECMYRRGNWRHSCGPEVESMMWNLTRSFSKLALLYPGWSLLNMDQANLCDVCQPGSDLATYDTLVILRVKLLASFIVKNQSPYLFRRCQVSNFPLNQCHLRLMWRKDVYTMLCHQVRTVIIPEVTPHLPICDFDDWIRSAARICDMGYQRFTHTASHIARCTKDQDELFPCYKGLFMDRLSWGLVSTGRNWDFGHYNKVGLRYRQAHAQTKMCSLRLYDHLRETCRHGPPVVQLIQDIRVFLTIDVRGILSDGIVSWHNDSLNMKVLRQRVNQC